MHQYEKKHDQEESISPLMVWIIASILLHALIALGFFTMRLKNVIPATHKNFNKKTDQALLMIDQPKQNKSQPKQSAFNQEPKKQVTQEEKKQKQSTLNTQAIPILMPGNKGLNKQSLEKPDDLKNLPTVENQKKEIFANNQKSKIMEKIESTENQLKKKIFENQSFQQARSKKETAEPEPYQDVILQQNKSSNLNPNRIAIDKQNPHDFVTEPSRIIALKDLGLGFNPNSKTVGNTQNLIMKGNVLTPPQGENLKYITYLNQCSQMMAAAVTTHRLYQATPRPQGRQYHFTITVDRNGKTIQFQTIQATDHNILNKIIEEAIQSINLFPQVPSFIPDNPFSMNWTFLH